ncbi:MAG: flagellar basal body rod protein FlgB [Candidatus Caldatribacterium sp.]|uniref:flagellar basal body rod protein FlgB n=1 Tax=Candidatus Caldatribacterium sp. TaxID=2282143 RepID=UPI002994335B|nr:flagellar basal body rod protein FlgB [Candidatus Caldatribacterium sp.]MCX7730087.1 flagellar basal body rod protein FlgB [Candidatus Caldatribacterium sp.]MDW8080987.1 flagellar basal body rod protein FlgB [Candidatus Calescibacterium sp.]
MSDITMDRAMRVIVRGLDYAMMRQRILAENVANVETPRYKRKDVDFTSALHDALQKEDTLPLSVTHPKHFADSATDVPSVGTVEEAYAVRQDRSGVDVEKEMTIVLENALYYQALARMMSDKLGLLRTVIREVR